MDIGNNETQEINEIPNTSLGIHVKVEMDPKYKIDVFKLKNEKILKEEVNEERQLNIVQELYNQCENLIEYKFNLIKNLEQKAGCIKQEADNNVRIRAKIEMEKKTLQNKVAKYTEHFKQLKIAIDICRENTESFKNSVKESQENIEEFQREDKIKKDKLRNEVVIIEQQIEQQIETNKMDIEEKETLIQQQEERVINLKLQETQLRKSLDENNEQKLEIIKEIQNLNKQTDEFTSEFTQLKDKYQNCQNEFDNGKLQYLNIIEKFNVESVADVERIANLEREREHLQSIFDNQNTIMNETQEKYNQLELSVSDFEECVSGLKHDILDFEKEYGEQKAKLIERLTISEQILNTLQTTFKCNEDMNNIFKERIEEYENTYMKFDSELKTKRANNQKLHNTFEQLKKEEQDCELKYTKIIDDLTNEINKKDIDYEGLLKKYKALQADLEIKKVEVTKVISMRGSSMKMYDKFENKAQIRLSNLKQENKKLEENINNIEKEIEQFKRITTEKQELNKSQYQQKIKLARGETDKIKKRCEVPSNKTRKEIDKFIEQTKKMELLKNELKTGIEGIQNELGKKNQELMEKSKYNEKAKLLETSELKIPPAFKSNVFNFESHVQNLESSQKSQKIDRSLLLRRTSYPHRTVMFTSDSDSDYPDAPKEKLNKTIPKNTSPMFKEPLMRKPTKEVKKRKSRK